MLSTPGWAFIMHTSRPSLGRFSPVGGHLWLPLRRLRPVAWALVLQCSACLPSCAHSLRFEPWSILTRERAMRALAGCQTGAGLHHAHGPCAGEALLCGCGSALACRQASGSGRRFWPWQACTTRSLPCSHAGHWLVWIWATRAMKICAVSWATGFGVGMCKAALATASFFPLGLASSP